MIQTVLSDVANLGIGRRLLFAVRDKFDPHQDAAAANIADDLKLFSHTVQRRMDVLLDAGGPARHVLLDHDLDAFLARRA